MTRSLLTCVCALALFGCSSSSNAPAANDGGSKTDAPTGDSSPECTPYAAPANSTLMTPETKFGTDVLPIFKVSCGTSSSCHKDEQGNRIYLGSTSSADSAKIIANIVDAESMTITGMKIVKPGDPANSFLMHKVDNDFCNLEDRCQLDEAAPCGAKMPDVTLPDGAEVLPVATRDTIRRWIAQGAKNN